MTDHDTLHPDDEALSAVLDGEADVEQSAHADACDVCRARLATLRDTSVLLAAPVPPADSDRRDAAIAAALAVAVDARSRVVPMRRRRTPPAWLAAAAAIVVAIGAISVLANGLDGTADNDTSSDDSAAGSGDAGTDQPMAADSFTALAPAPIDGGDIGEVHLTTLRDTVEGAFAASARQSDAVAENGAPPEQSTELAAAVACEAEVREGNPGLGVLAYHASGTVDDETVAVLAFDVPPDRWVYVVAVDDCTIKIQQTYAP